MNALAKAREDGFTGTDDASLLENARLPIAVVRGSLRNIKITEAEDLRLAELLAPSEAEA